MKAKHLVWIRRISQTFFLLLFLLLLIESRLPQDIYLKYSAVLSSEVDLRIGWPVKFFFQLDPLVWLSSLLSGHQLIKGFWWALGLLLLTFSLGRIFCGFICPLGTIHHVVSRIKPALKGEHQNTPGAGQRLPYAPGCRSYRSLTMPIFTGQLSSFGKLTSQEILSHHKIKRFHRRI